VAVGAQHRVLVFADVAGPGPEDGDHRGGGGGVREAGHTVEVVVSEQLRSPAEVEADKVARQDDRAAALAERADRKHATAAAAEQRACELADMVPFGQPILVGHHSEGRARRDAARIQAAAHREVAAHLEAQEVDRRAATAAATTGQRYAPVTVANRIQRLGAELRRWERARDGHSRTLFTAADGTKRTEDTTAATGAYQDRALREIVRLGEEIAYWEQIRAAQAAEGAVCLYDRTTIAKGDAVKCSGRWYEVVRLNAKSVSVRTGYSWTDRIDYHRIQDHRNSSSDTETA